MPVICLFTARLLLCQMPASTLPACLLAAGYLLCRRPASVPPAAFYGAGLPLHCCYHHCCCTVIICPLSLRSSCICFSLYTWTVFFIFQIIFPFLHQNAHMKYVILCCSVSSRHNSVFVFLYFFHCSLVSCWPRVFQNISQHLVWWVPSLSYSNYFPHSHIQMIPSILGPHVGRGSILFIYTINFILKETMTGDFQSTVLSLCSFFPF